MVERFCAQGASVVVLDIQPDWTREVEFGLKAQGFTVTGIVGDVTVLDDVRKAVAACAAFGGIDVLVNNAGVSSPGPADLLDIPLEEWRRVMSVNLDGPLLCIREAGRAMKEQGRGGSIINMTSIAARSSYPRSGSYSVSKAALEALTRQAAVELGPYNIRVNAMSLGWFRTALNEHVYRQPGQLARRNALIPLRRIGSVDDSAKLAIFLASDDSSYITGESFECDGGLLASSLSHSVELARVLPLKD
jgi:NAD(P)-dependent dehydrogenase (short-subunit alcohol dehydrogenase family)